MKPTSLQALQLTEDIQGLNICYELLGHVSSENVTKDRKEGDDMLRIVRLMVLGFRKYAQHKLRNEFLANEKR